MAVYDKAKEPGWSLRVFVLVISISWVSHYENVARQKMSDVHVSLGAAGTANLGSGR